MWQKIKSVLLRPSAPVTMYCALAVLVAIQLVGLGTHVSGGHVYTEYNNYVIFKQSFHHLLQGKNLYIVYPDEQWDLYKYSPTFALVMGSLAWLPDLVGLAMWNLLNAVVFIWAVQLMPFNSKTRSLLLWFAALESLTSLQNAQSNGLMAGLIIAAYAHLQRGKPQWATLWIVIATFIKVYGAVGFCLFLFYPDKIKAALYAVLWTVVIAAMPLAVTSAQALVWQYRNWGVMMGQDEAASYGLSVMGWLHSWFGVSSGKRLVTIAGLALFLLPFCRWQLYRNNVYRLLILASVLIWVIIFNHKAESPTYIIAIAGAGIWYFASPRTTWRKWALAIVFIFTSLSPTDLFPPVVRNQLFMPYTIKAVPCILLWCVILAELMTMKQDRQLPEAAIA